MNSSYLALDYSKKTSGNPNAYSVSAYIQNPKQMAVKAISFVNNIYLINDYTYRLPVDVGSGTVYVSLTKGNYTATTLAVELAAKLTALGVGTFTVSYTSASNKFTFVGPVPWYFEFQDSEANQTIYQLLGFNKQQYDMSTVPYTIISPQQIRLTPTKWIDFCSIALARVLKNQNTQGNTFYRLYINDQSYGAEVAFYEHYRRLFDIVKNITIGSVDLELRDDQGRLCLFEENADISVLLEFFC
jgi:hypothetical protein